MLDCVKVILENILIKSECFIVFVLLYNDTQLLIAQSAGAVEYTDCFYAEG